MLSFRDSHINSSIHFEILVWHFEFQSTWWASQKQFLHCRSHCHFKPQIFRTYQLPQLSYLLPTSHSWTALYDMLYSTMESSMNTISCLAKNASIHTLDMLCQKELMTHEIFWELILIIISFFNLATMAILIALQALGLAMISSILAPDHD